MAHNAAFYQQQPPSQVPMYSHRQHQQQSPMPSQHAQQPRAGPPPNIYQQMGLQQPQPGQARPRAYQDPQYQQTTTLAVHDYWQQQQRQPTPQPMYTQSVQSAPSYMQPQVQLPPTQLPQHIPSQHAPVVHTVTGYQTQYQPPQPSYTPSPYQSSMTPQPQHPVHPTHSYTQSVPNVPYGAHVAPQYTNPVTNPPQTHTPIPPTTSAPNIPLAHQAMSSSRQPATGSRPLPQLAHNRSDSLPPSGSTSAPEPAPAATPSRTQYSTMQSNNPSAPQRQSGSFTSDTPTDHSLPARGMARTRSETAPFPSDTRPTSSSQFSRSSSSRPLSSFSAGATQSASDIPTPGAVSPGASTRRPLPNPSGGASRMAKHQSIDFSRFPGSASSAINATDSILTSRSTSPPKFMRDRRSDASTGGATSRSGSISPTKQSEAPIRRGPPGAAPTPFTQLPEDDPSSPPKRRPSPPRWVDSDRSRSSSPTKPGSTAAAPSKYPSPPGPARPSSSYAGSTSGNTSANSPFAAARSVFAKNSDTASGPTPPPLNASTRSGPSSTPPQPASPPKPKVPPVWKRTIPDRGDASKIDFIGRSTFNPGVFIDPPFPGTAAYARNLALANAGGIPGYAGPPPAGYRASIAGPPVGYGQSGPPPAGYGAYTPHPVPRQQSSHQRQPNSHEAETEEDSEEVTEGDGSDVSGSDESLQGKRSKGKGARGAAKDKSKARDKAKNGQGDKVKARSKEKSSARSEKGSDRTVKSKGKGSVKNSGSTKSKSRHRRGEFSEDEEDSMASASAPGPSDSEIDDRSGTEEEVEAPVLKKGQARQIALRELEKEKQREREREMERERQRELQKELEKEKERERQRREREEWERERREQEEWERAREQEEWVREKEKREREEWEREKERERREREEWEREKEKEKQKEREEWERQKQREREEWEREKQREIERERERLEKEKERELREKERQILQEREKLEREREKERERAREWERRQRDRSGSNPQFGNRDAPSRIPVRTHTSTFSMPTNGNPGPRPPPMVRDTGYRGENDFGHNRQNGNDRQRLYGLDLNLDDEPPPSLRRSPSPSSTAPSASTGYSSEIRSRANISRHQEQEKPSWTPRQQSSQQAQPQQVSWAQRPAPQQRQPQPSQGGRQSPVRFSPKKNQTQSLPSINIIESPSPIGGREKLADIPKIAFEGAVIDDEDETSSAGPSINIQNFDENPSARGRNAMPPPSNVPKVQVFEVPGIGFSGPDNSDGPIIAISGPDDDDNRSHQPPPQNRNQRQPFQRQPLRQTPPVRRATGTGLICGGCGGPIIGRIVSAMNLRWHPDCFRCAVCSELLEHVSSYEHDGRPYCHLDYHENFAPKCYHCKTAIIEERFISLDDPALGKRNYHEQHFFCAECGDPFLPPSTGGISKGGELTLSGDGQFESDDVAFTVYKGHPYCENCHVRLRMPKCKRCKQSIRDGDQAVEALGGKWCWGCFVCASCHNPFEDPAFFERGGQPYCEPCFSVILRNEI